MKDVRLYGTGVSTEHDSETKVVSVYYYGKLAAQVFGVSHEDYYATPLTTWIIVATIGSAD